MAAAIDPSKTLTAKFSSPRLRTGSYFGSTRSVHVVSELLREMTGYVESEPIDLLLSYVRSILLRKTQSLKCHSWHGVAQRSCEEANDGETGLPKMRSHGIRLAMSLRRFDELVAIFPDLGKFGTLTEAQAYNIPSITAAQLSIAHASYSTQLQAAIQFWTENNKKILPFIGDEDRLGKTAAFDKVIAVRSKWLSDNGHSQTPDTDGRDYANLVKHHAYQLRSISHRLSFGSNLIFRGEALDSLRVGIDYAIGRRISYPLPRSFTIEAEFIPFILPGSNGTVS